jgi:hypothetical protein
MHEVIFKSCYISYKFSPWIEWLCICISTKYWQVTYSYLAKEVSGILDIIFLITIHIQELGFKGLGFRQSWIWVFIAKSVLSLCKITLLPWSFRTFDSCAFALLPTKLSFFLVYVSSFRVVSFLAYVCSSRISKVLFMHVAPKLLVSCLCMQL